MKRRPASRASLALFASAVAVVLPAPAALADSLAASSAAGGSSASSASSASSDTSSDSSSKTGGTAAGPYRIVEVAALPEQPDTLRLTMQPQDDGLAARPGLVLQVPRRGFERSGLVVGSAVIARPRPYGTEFAAAETRLAFFLVIDDAWSRELAARPVTL